VRRASAAETKAREADAVPDLTDTTRDRANLDAPITLVTHDRCLDGATCAVVGMAAGLVPTFVYPDGAAALLASLPSDRRVVLADVSFAPDVYQKEAHRLVALIDHHQSARPLGGLPRVHIDQRHCASTLLYEWLTATGRLEADDARWRPLLNPVDDYDLWRPDHAAGQGLNRLLMEKGFDWFRGKYRDGYAPLTQDEEALLHELVDREHNFIARYAPRAEAFSAGPHRLMVVRLEEEGAVNELSHTLLTDHGADAVIVIKPDGRLSCRSTPAIDAARLMEQAFQGGGHPRAAGGRLKAGLDPEDGVRWVAAEAVAAITGEAR
jgi:oligoribonuclease NrnB/cAMP/cGMP phosphodiesterase (DHH superfamily)